MSDLSIIKKTIDSINPLWESFKKEIDKYPSAFELKFDKEEGYLLTIDLDVVAQVQENLNP
jgi:hypothetical protein